MEVKKTIYNNLFIAKQC